MARQRQRTVSSISYYTKSINLLRTYLHGSNCQQFNYYLNLTGFKLIKFRSPWHFNNYFIMEKIDKFI